MNPLSSVPPRSSPAAAPDSLESRRRWEHWTESDAIAYGRDAIDAGKLAQAVRYGGDQAAWRGPRRPIIFVSDLHADYEAFLASLNLAGAVVRNGSGERAFELTRSGARAHFVIGGDCLDKGTSNLKLLDSIRRLLDLGARVTLLAGNHDLRFLLGLRTLKLALDGRDRHFFLRMGPKVVPLLREVFDRHELGRNGYQDVPDAQACRDRLYPQQDWFDTFPSRAGDVLHESALHRELARMRCKLRTFESACAQAGLSIRDVYAAAIKCHELFLETDGAYYWFFDRMELAYRAGAYLFVHAGLDDQVAGLIGNRGLEHLNGAFWTQLRADAFGFYFGPLANVIRTKYRTSDRPLTARGVAHLRRCGIHAIVHGHQNRTAGQRLVLRGDLLHIECDVTLDINSRRKEGLAGYGAGATIFSTQGQVTGTSTDYPFAKRFDPRQC